MTLDCLISAAGISPCIEGVLVLVLTKIRQRNNVHDAKILVGFVAFHFNVELISDRAEGSITSNDILCFDGFNRRLCT